MTRFYIAPKKLEKWMHQNGASYTGTMVEGCLLDNFVLVCRRGYAAVYEHYLNCWSSNYLVEFEPGAAQEVWRRWYQFETAGGKTCLISQDSTPAPPSAHRLSAEKSHCLFQGSEFGMYPFCDPEKDECRDIMCPYWIEEGHTS